MMCWEGVFSVMPSDVKNLELGRGVVRDGKCNERNMHGWSVLGMCVVRQGWSVLGRGVGMDG